MNAKAACVQSAAVSVIPSSETLGGMTALNSAGLDNDVLSV